MNNFPKFIKKFALPLALLIFLSLFATDALFVSRGNASGTINPLPKDTSISKDFSPRIDSEAAAIVREKKAERVCVTLPAKIWIFLLTAYLFLMLFNLFYDFEKSNKLHWFWEGLYAILAIFVWVKFDKCGMNLWFPLYVLKLGVVIYLVYLWLYHKKKEIQAT